MISRQTAEHFTWRDVCDGWYLVNQPDRLTVLKERMPCGRRVSWRPASRHAFTRAVAYCWLSAGVRGSRWISPPHQRKPQARRPVCCRRWE